MFNECLGMRLGIIRTHLNTVSTDILNYMPLVLGLIYSKEIFASIYNLYISSLQNDYVICFVITPIYS